MYGGLYLTFLIQCLEVRLEPQMRTLRSVLALKSGSSSKSVVYVSYKSNDLAFLTFKSLHKWSDNFFFIFSKIELWAFGHV